MELTRIVILDILTSCQPADDKQPMKEARFMVTWDLSNFGRQ